MADDPTRAQVAVDAVDEEVRAWRRAHPDATLTEIEQALDARLRAARAALLAEVAGDVPHDEERCPGCGERLVAPRRTDPDAADTHGDAPLDLTRAYLHLPGLRGRAFPPSMSAWGCCPGSPLTPWLVEGIVRLGACVPFAEGPALLAHFTGVHGRRRDGAPADRGGRGGPGGACETAAVAALERTLPEPPPGPAVQLLSVDGAMVPLVGGVWAEVKTLAVGEVVAAADGPRTTALSYFSRLADADDVRAAGDGGDAPAGHGDGRDGGGGRRWGSLVPGLRRPAPARRGARSSTSPTPSAHLGAVAQAVFGPGTAAASAWLGEQAHRAAAWARRPRCWRRWRAPGGAPSWRLSPRRCSPGPHAYLAARREQIRVPGLCGGGLPDRQRLRRERQQAGGRGAAQRGGHALGAAQRRPDAGAADADRQRPLGGGVAGDLGSAPTPATGASAAARTGGSISTRATTSAPPARRRSAAQAPPSDHRHRQTHGRPSLAPVVSLPCNTMTRTLSTPGHESPATTGRPAALASLSGSVPVNPTGEFQHAGSSP